MFLSFFRSAGQARRLRYILLYKGEYFVGMPRSGRGRLVAPALLGFFRVVIGE